MQVINRPAGGPGPRSKLTGATLVLAGLSTVALLLSACSSNAPSAGSSPAPSSGSALRHGGTLRVGIVSLSTADALDPAMASTEGGYATATQLFDTLDQYGTNGKVTMRLAKSMRPQGSAKTWIVTLRAAKWSNGKPVTAADLVYTINRILNKKHPLPPASSIPFIDPAGMSVLNQHTVTFELKYPTVDFLDAFTSPLMSIVPRGFNPKKPIGSGPFVLTSDTPGTRITFTANKYYWNKPRPYVHQLELISFPNSTSQVNALIGGQIEVASSIEPSLVRVVKAAGSGFKVYSYPTSSTLTWQMNVSKKPFNDPRVREALRLAVNRQQIVRQVYDGYATLGNDIFSPYDEGYNRGLPQRAQDIAKAKQLLAAAGYPHGVSVQLTAAPIYPTADLQNEVLVQQAKAAGFNITFHKVDIATYYGSGYGTYPLSLSFWGDLSIFDQAAFTIVKNAPYNATHWQSASYDALYGQAVRTVNTAKRVALVHKMQQIEYTSGPYVVADFMDNITAYRSTVGGQLPYPNTDGASGYYFATMGFKS
jgi:peptide/nickel transport system substrate-binding protein